MKFFITVIIALSIFSSSIKLADAQSPSPSPTATPRPIQTRTTPTPKAVTGQVILESDATTSADATLSAETATPSATTEQKIQDKKDQDITETGGKQKSRLEQFLDDNPPEPLSWNNFIQHAIRYAVAKVSQ